MASTFCTPSFVSIWIITTTLSFADLMYSAALIPQWPCVNGLPKPRLPPGGKRLSATTSLAFSAVLTYSSMQGLILALSSETNQAVPTIGTSTPRAPASSAYLICQDVLLLTPVAGILTSALGALGPRPVMAWIDSAAPGWSEVRPCSQSIMTHERCGLACASARAFSTPGRVIHAPNAGLEALKACRREWVVMAGK